MRTVLRSLVVLAVLAASSGFAAWQATRFHAALAPDAASETGGPPARRPGGPRGGGGGGGASAPEVALARAETAQVAPVTTAYGRVTAPRSVALAPAVAGRVAFVAPDLRDGAQVAAGQTLLRIDDTEARLALGEAQAGRATAQAGRDDARRRIAELQAERALLDEVAALREANLERIAALAAGGGAAAATRDEAEAAAIGARQALATQDAEIAAAESQLRQAGISVEQADLAVARAERHLADHELVAPIAGLYAGTVPVEGQDLAATAIGRITDLDRLEVRLDLTRAMLGRVTDATGAALPLEAAIHPPGGGPGATARLDRLTLEAAGEAGERSVAVLRITDQPCACLRPGDFVEARISEPEITGVPVPHEALTADGALLVPDPEGVLQKIAVDLLRRTADTAILGPGAAGLRYVADPGPELFEGARIALPAAEHDAEPAADATPEMVEIDAETRARLVARLESGAELPAPLRARIESALETGTAPAALLQRLAGRAGE